MSTAIKIFWTKFFLFFILVIFCTGIILPALQLEIFNSSTLSFISKYNYSIICHQFPAKSFLIDGNHFMVCARCTGIFTGALIISALFLFISNLKFKNLLPLIFSSVLMIADVAAVNIGIYSYSKAIAFSTGLMLGSVICIYLYEVIEQFLEINFRKTVLEK